MYMYAGVQCMYMDRRVGLYECVRVCVCVCAGGLASICVYMCVPISMADKFISRMGLSMCTGQCRAAP